MVDSRAEQHLGWHHRVLLGKEDFGREKTSSERSFVGALDLHEEVAVVLRIWFGVNSDDRFGSELLRLLHNSRESKRIPSIPDPSPLSAILM